MSVLDFTIRGTVVITPREWFPADVHVHDGRIMAIGALDAQAVCGVSARGQCVLGRERATRVEDHRPRARGAIVPPG